MFEHEERSDNPGYLHSGSSLEPFFYIWFVCKTWWNFIGEVIRPDLSNSGEFKRQTASEIAI